MKRKLAILLAITMFAAAAPVLAGEGRQNAASQQSMDEQCARECAMLLKNCAQEADSIQDRIRKLQAAVGEKGANAYTREELKILRQKLAEANETLRVLNKP